MGAAALHHNISGNYNTCVGHNAGAGVATYSFSNNAFFGSWAGAGSTTGGNNSYFGYRAGYVNSTGNENVFMGYKAGYANTTATSNVFVGSNSGLANTNGSNNTFVGYGSGDSHTTGSGCVFMGYQAGQANSTSSNNTFVGFKAGYSNTTGDLNCSYGGYALYTNSTGIYNTSIGYQSLYNTTVSHNSALGLNAGFANTSGVNSVFIGESAGGTNTTGSNNTYLGYGADANAAAYSNSVALGKSSVLTASNMVHFATSATTVVEGPVAYTIYSDGRFKTDVTENVKGLEFINKLRPVTYKLNTEALDDFTIQAMPDSVKAKHKAGLDFSPSMAIVHSGFIAQEVEIAGQDAGFTSSIVKTPANSNDPYGISYAEIVVPLVKAVQELSKSADSANSEEAEKDSTLAVQIAALQNQINQLSEALNNCCSSNHSMQQNGNSGSTSAIDVNLKDDQSIVLEQNVPNPFAEQTSIGYFLPENVGRAQMLFYNAQGKLIQSVELSGKGKGSLNVFAPDLSNGAYTYTLVVDGKIIETKKMVKQQ